MKLSQGQYLFKTISPSDPSELMTMMEEIPAADSDQYDTSDPDSDPIMTTPGM